MKIPTILFMEKSTSVPFLKGQGGQWPRLWISIIDKVRHNVVKCKYYDDVINGALTNNYGDPHYHAMTLS